MTWKGRLNIRNAQFAHDWGPLEEAVSAIHVKIIPALIFVTCIRRKKF